MSSYTQLVRACRSAVSANTNQSRRGPGLGVETLEGRQLMSVNYDAVNDMINIRGTDDADSYLVASVLIDGTEVLRVSENGVNHDFDPAERPVAGIQANLMGGNDFFSMHPSIDLPAVVRGGPGDDVITLASSDDSSDEGSDKNALSKAKEGRIGKLNAAVVDQLLPLYEQSFDPTDSGNDTGGSGSPGGSHPPIGGVELHPVLAVDLYGDTMSVEEWMDWTAREHHWDQGDSIFDFPGGDGRQ